MATHTYNGGLLIVNTTPQTLESLALSGDADESVVVAFFPNNSSSQTAQIAAVTWGAESFTQIDATERTQNPANFTTDCYVWALTGHAGGTNNLQVQASDTHARQGTWVRIKSNGVDVAQLDGTAVVSQDFLNENAPSIAVSLSGAGDVIGILEDQDALDALNSLDSPLSEVAQYTGSASSPGAPNHGARVGIRVEGSGGSKTVSATLGTTGPDPWLVAIAFEDLVVVAPVIDSWSLSETFTVNDSTVTFASLSVTGTYTGYILVDVASGAGAPAAPSISDPDWITGTITPASTTFEVDTPGDRDVYLFLRNSTAVSTAGAKVDLEVIVSPVVNSWAVDAHVYDTRDVGISALSVAGGYTDWMVIDVPAGDPAPTAPTSGDPGWISGAITAGVTTFTVLGRGSLDVRLYLMTGTLGKAISAASPIESTIADIVALYRVWHAGIPEQLLAEVDVDTEPGFNPELPGSVLTGLTPATYNVEVSSVSSLDVEGARSNSVQVTLVDELPPVTAGPPIVSQAGNTLNVAMAQAYDDTGYVFDLEYRAPAGTGGWVTEDAAIDPISSDPENPAGDVVYPFDVTGLSGTIEFRYRGIDTSPATNTSAYETGTAHQLLEAPGGISVVRLNLSVVRIIHNSVTGAAGYRYGLHTTGDVFVESEDGASTTYDYTTGDIAGKLGVASTSDVSYSVYSALNSFAVWSWPTINITPVENAGNVTFTVYTTADEWASTLRVYVDTILTDSQPVADLGGGQYGAVFVVDRSSSEADKSVVFTALEITVGTESPGTTPYIVDSGSVGEPLVPEKPVLQIVNGASSSTVSWAAVTTPAPAIAYDVYVGALPVVRQTGLSVVVMRGVSNISVQVASVGNDGVSPKSVAVTVPLILGPSVTLREPRDGTTIKEVDIF